MLMGGFCPSGELHQWSASCELHLTMRISSTVYRYLCFSRMKLSSSQILETAYEGVGCLGDGNSEEAPHGIPSMAAGLVDRGRRTEEGTNVVGVQVCQPCSEEDSNAH
jgi:hypothetical protein